MSKIKYVLMKISSSVQAQRQKGDSCLDDLQHAVYYMKYLRANYKLRMWWITSHENTYRPLSYHCAILVNPWKEIFLVWWSQLLHTAVHCYPTAVQTKRSSGQEVMPKFCASDNCRIFAARIFLISSGNTGLNQFLRLAWSVPKRDEKAPNWLKMASA